MSGVFSAVIWINILEFLPQIYWRNLKVSKKINALMETKLEMQDRRKLTKWTACAFCYKMIKKDRVESFLRAFRTLENLSAKTLKLIAIKNINKLEQIRERFTKNYENCAVDDIFTAALFYRGQSKILNHFYRFDTYIKWTLNFEDNWARILENPTRYAVIMCKKDLLIPLEKLAATVKVHWLTVFPYCGPATMEFVKKKLQNITIQDVYHIICVCSISRIKFFLRLVPKFKNVPFAVREMLYKAASQRLLLGGKLKLVEAIQKHFPINCRVDVISQLNYATGTGNLQHFHFILKNFGIEDFPIKLTPTVADHVEFFDYPIKWIADDTVNFTLTGNYFALNKIHHLLKPPSENLIFNLENYGMLTTRGLVKKYFGV